MALLFRSCGCACWLAVVFPFAVDQFLFCAAGCMYRACMFEPGMKTEVLRAEDGDWDPWVTSDTWSTWLI